MKALTKKTKIILITAVVAALLLLGLVVVFLPALIQPVLWTLLLLGVGFFLVDFWFRRKRRRKQKNFDEKVAAKEGIEDRRREWTGWLEELERQGLDRYELPFYLLVGEPQSGKSVLLQNSDLYFPFGQERLSGVGGTRGCDWWFTDEAVILDIAGRLFTHEGGVADRLEWESFLDLLTDFRPMCPANGVLLVVPCDALLADSPEVCADKANKIQSALLTVTQKLQAQLPVYLVLTKADRVFGFAESVHRLDGEERHQMFGWSREADRADKPFELEEARAGFAGLVDRARLLRERMIASARLPEALPEIDRMYAFPDELNGMYRSLEIYLKRIFTQSSLVERASFRGIYLTSGLQSGAPVARVCAELLGADRESDARTLESLFSHQRAYFIKDLVRKRVFAERGLVRPTEGRVLAARRTAFLGYGAAAAVAAVAVVGSALHLWRERGGEAERICMAALDAGRDAVQQTEVTALLRGLDTVRKAVEADRELMQDVFHSSREGFERLYAKVCDRALAPAVRRKLEEALVKRAEGEPESYAQFEELLDASLLVYEDLDFSSKESIELAKKWLPADWATRVADAGGGQAEFSVADALQQRRGSGSAIAPVGDRTRLDAFARRMLVLLDRAIDPATTWMPRGHFGYMVARRGAEETERRIQDGKDRPPADYLQLCDVFANSLVCIDGMLPGLTGGVTNIKYGEESSKLLATWTLFRAFTSPGAPSATWLQLKAIDDYARALFAEPAHQTQEVFKVSVFSGSLGRITNQLQQRTFGTMLAKVPPADGSIARWRNNTADRDACSAEPRAAWTVRSVAGLLGPNHARLNDVYRAKVQVMASQLAARYPNWEAARNDFHRAGGAPAADQLDQQLLVALAQIRSALNLYRLKDSPAAQQVSRLMCEHLRAVDAAWAARKDHGSKIDWSVPSALTRLATEDGLGAEVPSLADQVRWTYLGPHEERLQREWRDLADGTESTLAVLAAMNEHFGQLAELEKDADGKPVPLLNPQHKAWLERVDGDLAGRLQKHLDALLRYWRPDTSGWNTLRQAAENVLGALDNQSVRTKTRDAKKVDAPPADCQEFRAGQPITEATSLPESNKAMAALRNFTTPTDTDIRTHRIATKLQDVSAQLLQQLDAGNDLRLVAMAIDLAPLPPATASATTTEHYLRPLFEALQTRLVAEVRTRYLRAVGAAISLGGSDVIDALYTSDPERINAIADQDVVRRLATLLDPQGRFDVVRRDYRMLADPKDPTKLHLRPPDDHVAPDAERAWWQFERFLGALQALLVRGEAKVASASFRVRYELPVRAAGPVWDISETKKQFVYYGTHSAGKSAPGFLAFDQEWGKFEKPLTWEFNDSKRPTLWLLWTSRVRTELFQWPQDRDRGDLVVELTGCLAPLLLAWSGNEDAGWWTVSLAPQNATDKARLRISFQGVDGVDLVLPPRPPRPAAL